MADKTFVVTHSKAREPITITGKSLAKALKKERLNPDIWKPIEPASPPSEEGNGEAD